ncbi:ATP-binding protein [Streptomyces sp. UNOC14_S4]|nr:ATP-binding protein [Streptomyces sp. UNOC14_S4]
MPEGPGRTGARLRPRGLVDLRGERDAPALFSYPPGAVVVVSGLPGSGKSTLLRRWSGAAAAVDPRDVHEACEAVMPARVPYAVYRPWARFEHFRWLRAGARTGEPLLVHDCGSRPWMRRYLARAVGRQGRELHVVLLDVGAAEALAGQEARGRRAPGRAFARHERRLRQLVRRLSTEGAEVLPEAVSVVLLDRTSRQRPRSVEFAAAPPRVPGPRTAPDDGRRTSHTPRTAPGSTPGSAPGLPPGSPS